MGAHFLEPLFAPRAVAVFGASDRPDSVGGRVLENLIDGGFQGGIYPINPKYAQVRGRRCYPSLREVNADVDVAAIATPASTVIDVIRDCGEHGVRAAIVHSAGFSEAQAEGRERARAVVAEAGRYGMRLLGPNCLGLMRPAARVNATFSKSAAREGTLALISQSGALCTAILDWADTRGIGFSGV